MLERVNSLLNQLTDLTKIYISISNILVVVPSCFLLCSLPSEYQALGHDIIATVGAGVCLPDCLAPTIRLGLFIVKLRQLQASHADMS